MKRNVFAVRHACRTGRAAIDTGGFHRKPKLAIGPFVLIDKRLPTRIVCEEKLALASDCWLGNLCHTQNVPLPPRSKNSGSYFQIGTSGRSIQIIILYS